MDPISVSAATAIATTLGKYAVAKGAGWVTDRAGALVDTVQERLVDWAGETLAAAVRRRIENIAEEPDDPAAQSKQAEKLTKDVAGAIETADAPVPAELTAAIEELRAALDEEQPDAGAASHVTQSVGDAIDSIVVQVGRDHHGDINVGPVEKKSSS